MIPSSSTNKPSNSKKHPKWSPPVKCPAPSSLPSNAVSSTKSPREHVSPSSPLPVSSPPPRLDPNEEEMVPSKHPIYVSLGWRRNPPLPTRRDSHPPKKKHSDNSPVGRMYMTFSVGVLLPVSRALIRSISKRQSCVCYSPDRGRYSPMG